jgi:DNA-binding transcriptional regulator YhcF (GntR family)
MSTTVQIDLSADAPPYAQIAAQLRRAILIGALGPGDQLATVRQLARDLGVAANTVARAYRELDDDGLIVTGGRRGTFVSPGLDRASAARQELDRAVRRFTTEVADLRIVPAEAIAAVSAALAS